jgi:zinc/manganese transport system substrate-binding protein
MPTEHVEKVNPMRTILLMLTLWVAAPAAQARPTVVATLPDLGAIARAVGGAECNVVVLAEPNQDPHYVDPRPSFLVALSRADLLLFNGLDLEIGWLPSLITNARNARIQPGAIGHVDASSFVSDKLGVLSGKVDRAHGDIHAGGNPHFLLDPGAVAEVARGFAGQLALIDGKNAVSYVRRAEVLAEELTALAARERARFAMLSPEARRVVVYHDSLPYLVRWLGLEQIATIENKPGIKPSPAHVARVMDLMRARGARVILQERWHPEGVARNLAKLADATLVPLQGGAEDGQSYIARLTALAQVIHDALSR